MNLGTPRKLMHVAAAGNRPAPDHDDATPQADSVERILVVEEPAVPDDVADLDGGPTTPAPRVSSPSID